MADSLASAPAAPVTPTAAAGAQKRKAEKTLEADTVARGGHGTALATRGAAEQGRLICWLLYVAAASSLPSGVLVGHHCQRSASPAPPGGCWRASSRGGAQRQAR